MSLSPRIAFQIGRRGGLRAADELVEQLADQLRFARRERYELAVERHAAATHAVIDAFGRLERSPDTVLH